MKLETRAQILAKKTFSHQIFINGFLGSEAYKSYTGLQEYKTLSLRNMEWNGILSMFILSPDNYQYLLSGILLHMLKSTEIIS